MQLQTVEHAVLDVDEDEVRFGGSNELRHECARYAMGYAHKGFARICVCIFERLPEIARIGEHRRAVRCIGVELFLLAVGLEVCHLEIHC